MSQARTEQAGRHRVIQTIVALYSFVFFGVIAYGYFYLAVGLNVALALLIAIVAATLAWFLAKFIGQSDGGIRANVPAFALLLLISATGVYNSAMINLEGGRIVSETAGDSQERFAQLKRAAQSAFGKDIAAYNDVIGLRDSLIAELRNPANCGQGNEADRILDRLERALPGFRRLSAGGERCAQIERVAAEYRSKVDELLPTRFPNLMLIGEADSARDELRALQAQATTDYAPSMLRTTKGLLVKQNDRYRDLYGRLEQAGGRVDDLPTQLDMAGVQNLGDATKLPMLFIDRLDRGSTYVYLAIAIFFDWLMIYFFQQARRNQVRRPATRPALEGAW
jgi:hypothetical protein